MAEFTISGRMKVKTLKENFNNAFGSNLRVYIGNKFADDDSTLASIRKNDDKKSGELKINGNMLVGNFEEKFFESFGIKVQVSDSSNSNLVDNKISLSKSKE